MQSGDGRVTLTTQRILVCRYNSLVLLLMDLHAYL